MKSILIYSKLPANGMAIYPFVILKNKSLANDPFLINHEKIHLKQQIELLIFPFYIAYLFHYLINLLIYRNHRLAYLNIVFEKEAYALEEDLNYLGKRKFFAWTAFL